jgi:SAM-dependent methyltransferase
MPRDKDFYSSTYGNYTGVLAEIRAETYGVDLGQSSWVTADEYEHFCEMLKVDPASRVLETASGSGGPAMYMSEKLGCSVTGIDINDEGIANGNRLAADKGNAKVKFERADVGERFPFDDDTFDAAICIDAANHFADRAHVVGEWFRVLKPGGRLLFTDPVVITGPVTNRELFDRSNIGFFVFIPPEVTEEFIEDAGFKLIGREDVTANIASTSGRWLGARAARRDAVLEVESETDFESLQTFLTAVHTLTSERRLSRFAFLAEK